MSPQQNLKSTKCLRCIVPEDVFEIERQIKGSFAETGLEMYPFKIAWYNNVVSPEYQLNYPSDTLAFVLISSPSMFEKAFLPFLANTIGLKVSESNDAGFADPIDKCMKHYFEILRKKLSFIADSAVDTIHDFEIQMPQRRAKILLQTAAHVSGAAYYYKNKNAKHCLGVCIHPAFGGWFGIRGAFICKQLLVPELIQKSPLDVVPPEKRGELLRRFNECWRDNSYRDIIPVKSRYSALQIEYFSLKPKDRFEFIRSTIMPLLKRCDDQPPFELLPLSY